MTKYIKKSVIVEADQFLLEEHHLFLGGEKPIHIPEEVEMHKGCGYRMCPICGGGNPEEKIYYITISGDHRYLSNGDWILTNENGNKDICRADDFNKIYEKLK